VLISNQKALLTVLLIPSRDKLGWEFRAWRSEGRHRPRAKSWMIPKLSLRTKFAVLCRTSRIDLREIISKRLDHTGRLSGEARAMHTTIRALPKERSECIALDLTLHLWLNSVVSVSGTALVRPRHLRAVSVAHPIRGVISSVGTCNPTQSILFVPQFQDTCASS